LHDENIKECDGLPSISIDYENLNQNCPKAWELLSSGHTKGVFQLETQLGQSWSKRLEPWNMEELSALISLLRPGCLRAIVDGKSMTQHYIDRKHNREESTYLDPSLETVLDNTYGVLTYQEQAMRIAQELAGFDLQQADILRKAIGKKKAEIMTQCENDFLEGCRKTQVVDEEKAKTIFSWIRESQRYSFNKSHGYGYGTIGYWSAYVKAHFPLHFFTSWLYFSHEKPEQQQEVQELISDAKLLDIHVRGPKLKNMSKGDGSFSLDSDGISFGIRDIKRIGHKYVEKFLAKVRNYEEENGSTI
jgi:DNA polymerase-3 subunit alpha